MRTRRSRLVAVVGAVGVAALTGAAVAIAATMALVAHHRAFMIDLNAGQYGRYHVAFREDGGVVGRATVTLTRPLPACVPPAPTSTLACSPPPP